MARESKGQQVKSFKLWVPQPDLSTEETVARVYFKADEGAFYIYVPEHITTLLPHSLDTYETRETYHGRGGYVRGAIMDRVIEGFKAVLRIYESEVKNSAREKVILVNFAANHPGRSQYTQERLEGISFTGRPAIFIDHEVLWRVKNTLYRIGTRDQKEADEEGRTPHMHFVSHMPGHETYKSRTQKTFVLDWTEERETFFVGIAGGMRNMIEACMALLFGDTSNNVDLLIANGGVASLISAPTLLLASKAEAQIDQSTGV